MRIGSNYNSNILLSLTTSLKQISNNQPGSTGEMKLPDSISDQRANISIIISNSNLEPTSTIKTQLTKDNLNGIVLEVVSHGLIVLYIIQMVRNCHGKHHVLLL